MTALLSIENLSLRFQGAPTDAVHNLSLSLGPGELLALVGESGSGKSVTALSVLQLLPPSAQYSSGSIRFQGRELMGRSEPRLRAIRGNRIAMIFQEPMTALNPLHTIGKQISESIELHQKLRGAELRARVLELLEMVRLGHFKERLNAFPHQLSGGERQRVMIAMAMANNPDLLIADEPTTALDVHLQSEILQLIKALQRERGMAVLLITHDLSIVRKMADRVAVMQNGVIVETSETRALFASPQHAYTKHLLASTPGGAPLPLPDGAAEVLRAESLRVHFPLRGGVLGRIRGYTKAVDGLSLHVKSGETLGIVGESGSGKSTLGLALLRLVKSEGPVVFLGSDTRAWNTSELRRRRREMQIVFQDPFASLNPRLTIFDTLVEGLRVHQPQMTRAAMRDAVSEILGQVSLPDDVLGRYPHEFSGGQRQRICVARAMILKPKLVVLDEPTSALDMSLQSQLVDLLKRFQQQLGLSYIFISHDLRVVRAISHRVMVLRAGQMEEEGPAETILSSPQSDYTKALVRAAFSESL